MEALRDLAVIVTDQRIANVLPGLLSQAMPWTRLLREEDIPAFISELATAAASGDGEKVAAAIKEWRATAEMNADPHDAARSRQALQEARDGKATPWEYDAAG